MYTKNQLEIIFRIKENQGKCNFPQNLKHCNNSCPFWKNNCDNINELYLKSNEILSTLSEEEIFEAML